MFRACALGLLALAAVSATAYAGTVGVSAALRAASPATVVPPTFYTGTASNDTINGSRRNDVLIGQGGNDRLNGGAGNDVVRAGDGNDRITGGPGRDTLLGGPGNDVFFARDRTRDVVNGGPGFDIAWVDRIDVVTGVERLYRR
jgi:Ca2+-binding RTX toxin-like protein